MKVIKIFQDSMFHKVFATLSIIFLINGLAIGQKKAVQKDSTRIYKNIETYYKKTKFTKLLFPLIFKPVSAEPFVAKKINKKLIKKKYNAYEGKIIRHIQIETLDPLEYILNDTIATINNILTYPANKFHIKSQNITIDNLILIRKNQVFDSIRVKESERLIRSKTYIRDVVFSVKAVAPKSDSVDILIRAFDNWSIIPEVSISTDRFSLGLTDENFLGLGHKFQNNWGRNYTIGKNAYNTSYSITNIRNTYISSSLNYQIDELKNSNRSISVERPFFSTFAKWGGGLYIAQRYRIDSSNMKGADHIPVTLKFNTADFWGGTSIRIFKGSSIYERTTNLILSARYLRVRYLLKPLPASDILSIYGNEDLYLFSGNLATQNFVQDKFIYNYGITEDVPVGKVFGFTGGYQIKNNNGRYYAGLNYTVGYYKDWGYMSYNLEIGSFITQTKLEQGALSARLNYFTPMFEIGKWRFRQFLKPELTIGINRYETDSLTLNHKYGLDGISSTYLSGSSRLLFALQTQSYAPWNLIGFRFGPFLNFSFGMLGNPETGFSHSKLYSQIGFGLLIKNENLVFNTFQISFSFYPIVPINSSNFFKINAFETSDLGFNNFGVVKSSIVNFK